MDKVNLGNYALIFLSSEFKLQTFLSYNHWSFRYEFIENYLKEFAFDDDSD